MMGELMANWFSARILLAGFIILFAALLLFLVVGNLRQNTTEAVLEIIRPDADLAMQKINYTETQDGQRKWSVQADSATHDLEGNTALVHKVRVVIYNQKDGDIIISAQEGSFDINGGIVTLHGNVILENLNGQSIMTEDLVFVDGQNLLKSENKVQLVSPDLELSGVGFRYNLEHKRLKLLSSVEARYRGVLSLP